MPYFRHRSHFPFPSDEVFDWHMRPGAFQRLTPPWIQLRALEGGGGADGGEPELVDGSCCAYVEQAAGGGEVGEVDRCDVGQDHVVEFEALGLLDLADLDARREGEILIHDASQAFSVLFGETILTAPICEFPLCFDGAGCLLGARFVFFHQKRSADDELQMFAIHNHNRTAERFDCEGF